jgi:hypothetical protein
MPLRSCLIGHTGFVGSNLARAHPFDAVFNSTNIADIRGQAFDLVVCAAPHAKKWWSNLHPEEDALVIRRLAEVLSTVEAQRVVLMSTIDVFPTLIDVDEGFDCNSLPNHAYGSNRLALEDAVRRRFANCHVIRLPALFGPGLKKNALFDMLHDNLVGNIDPQSEFQWYDVGRLWADLNRTVAAGIDLAVFATEPMRTETIRQRFFPGTTIGKPGEKSARYATRSRYADVYGGHDGYLMDREEILGAMAAFVDETSAGHLP